MYKYISQSAQSAIVVYSLNEAARERAVFWNDAVDCLHCHCENGDDVVYLPL